MLHDNDQTAPPEGPFLKVRQEILDVVIGSALVALAAWFWIAAGDIDDDGSSGIGPSAFPRGLALGLGIASLVFVGRAAVRIAARRFGPESITGRPLPVLAGVVFVSLFPALMSQFGYYPAMGFLIAALLWAAGYRGLLGIALYTAGFLAFTKVVFGIILKVPLP